MRNVEENSLKEGITLLKKSISSYSSLNELFGKIEDIEIPSLQEISFKKDKSSLEEFSSILNVAFSIASKPFSLNKKEEIIESSSRSNGLSSEAVRKTLMDSSLWKRYGDKMVPEQVYYFQYYDEYIIYENIFIITFIESLYEELERCRSFYVSLLGVYPNRLNIDDDYLSIALKQLNKMFSKLDRIKDTSFYKRVSKSPKRIKSVIPSNILLHNQKYNAVYKFYKNMISYYDDVSLNADLARYYYFLLLKNLKLKGFKLRENKELPLFDNKEIALPTSIHFKNKDFDLSLSYLSSSFLIEIAKGKLRYSSLLNICPNEPFSVTASKNKCSSYDYISLWHLGYQVDDNVILLSNDYLDEMGLISTYLDSHLYIEPASEDIYSKYCPICKEDELVERGRDTYYCPFCNSTYHLEEEKIIFISRRKK